MGLHFTYSEPDTSTLRQGDILKKTPALLELIREIHPHYASDEYTYFQVLTQSCDLVRRSGQKCKSRYITLAAVRPLELVIQRALEKIQEKTEFQDKIFCSDVNKKVLEDFVNKLLNNNDTNHFFLQAEPQFGIEQNSCTQLHLSISIRAYEHYDVCLAGKILELKENFRAKLGWLIGNLYSRVGTEDYFPTAIPDQNQYKKYVSELLEQYVAWIPKADFSQFKKNTLKHSRLDDIESAIIQAKQLSTENQIKSLVSAISKAMQLDDHQRKTLTNVLAQQPIIKKIAS